MRCASCDHKKLSVERTYADTAESVVRQRKCPKCGHTVFTVEVELPKGATRFFSKDKIKYGIKRLPGFLRVNFS